MTEFAGLRVLVLEDEGAVALLIEAMLEQISCEVVASVARLSNAERALETKNFDVAVLDVNVAGETSFPFARALASRNIPFVFSTGYGSTTLPADLEERPVLTKPFTVKDLQAALARALG